MVQPANPRPTPPVENCWFLTGATASGKSGVSLKLAHLLDAEIISMDSMSIYRGMDIGTAKLAEADRENIPHHLIDLIDADKEFSLSQYVAVASEKICEIQQRGRQVLFVGGTPLYLKAMLRGLFEGPPADWEFRQQVSDEILQLGETALHDRLKQVDPLSAAKFHPNDHRRIIRALEVYKLTGQPISHMQTQFEDSRSPDSCRVFVLQWPRAELHQRIDARVDRMFAENLVEEVQRLQKNSKVLSRTAAQAVGYREVFEHLAGQLDLAEATSLIKIRTHRFAKHQETWFRSLEECRFIPRSEGISAAAVADCIARQGNE